MTEAQVGERGLKAGWRTVKFGNVVKNANLTEHDPGAAGIKRIVGLDHLDPENLHIRRWNTLENGTSFNRKFLPGQTLFGKRRAYQRKVAFAEFEGICSGDILTFEPKDPDVLLPELLPFICQTDAFFDHALGTSAGSLSPRTSWKALQDFDFPLPPIEEQKRIAEILWAADEAVESWVKTLERTETASRAVRYSLFQQLSQSEKCVSLANVGQWISGGTPSRGRSDYWGGDFPWVSPKDMKVDIISDTEEKLTSEALRERVTTIESEGILIVVRGMILAHTFPVALTGREVSFNQDMKGLVLDEEFLSRFIFHWFRSHAPKILQAVEGSSHGTKRLATDVLYKMQVPKPSKGKQDEVLKVLDSFHARLNDISEHLNASRNVCRAMRNEMLDKVHV